MGEGGKEITYLGKPVIDQCLGSVIFHVGSD